MLLFRAFTPSHLASTHRGKYSLFVVPTAPNLTSSDESAMNFAAHVTIFKGLLTRFQTLALEAVMNSTRNSLEAVMNSISNSLGMRETEIAREPSLLWNPHFYAIFAQVHNTL
jgi:hypothetical protein